MGYHKFYVGVQSGTTAKRKKLQRMIEDAQDKKFDIILAKELSRLARNDELSYKIKNLCEKNQGIHIITLDNAINTLTGNTNMFGLYTWMYEQESQNTSNRVKETLKTRAKKGLFKGSNPPYGYEVKEGKLFIRDDETPEIVRKIFREYLEGSGRESIARRQQVSQAKNERNKTKMICISLRIPMIPSSRMICLRPCKI
ncbi:recombinase family protein [Bacillus inaquosorum]|uniref:recombinase family protein n=1 Tax=Bacillus inaquosorum TaxID=483913 RepID=UPI002280479C|nr:recombinase family protein [Bacillus inaquosorum]MCY8996782.1 recombinase family protein [Bacillus inaquosorum]MCY9010085.1 recombinase family protein [Bacillus inaquosorum]MCY9035665.1 recombinase family protein [Bacillus inaquosorum]MCY9047030.1 recombinase family protein [Bacillus inaquosorum]